MNPHWIAVDCNFIAHHCFYGIAKRDGVVAVLTSILQIESTARESNAAGILWAFDFKPYHRSTIYPEYKAGRSKSNNVDQEALDELKHHLDEMPKYLHSLGYRSVYKLRGFEADDVIAGLCRTLPKNETLTIHSRDQDLLQLISQRVSIYDPASRVTTTRESFRGDYGIHPEEFAEAKSIAGCDSDNIPGADGVGIATAIKWLRGDSVGPKKLEAIQKWRRHPDYERNLKLVTLPYEGMAKLYPELDQSRPPGAWRSLCDQLERPGLGSNSDDREWRRACV